MSTHTHHSRIGIPFFRMIAGADPYPWQTRLYRALLDGEVPSTLKIPTGLGKTSAVPIYLLALAAGASLPRRLVYVVDRRAIVDQTAAAIRDWVERIGEIELLARHFDGLAAFPAPHPVPVGVLRGALADDGEWRLDPARPAVAVGTVDTIGSRLLFSGYGDGLSRRPLHAGLLGHDAFLLLDEAHLSPGMAGLVREIERLTGDGERPGFRALTFSAASDTLDAPFGLGAEDLAHPELTRRFAAPKTILTETVTDNARRIVRLVELAARFDAGSILIYVRSVRDAHKVAAKLAEHLGQEARDRLGLLTGFCAGPSTSGSSALRFGQLSIPLASATRTRPPATWSARPREKWASIWMRTMRSWTSRRSTP